MSVELHSIKPETLVRWGITSPEWACLICGGRGSGEYPKNHLDARCLGPVWRWIYKAASWVSLRCARVTRWACEAARTKSTPDFLAASGTIAYRIKWSKTGEDAP